MRVVSWAVAGLALLAAASASADVKVERVTYHEWPGAYRVNNGTVDLVLVPQIGRIMRFGFVGGPNALWENPEMHGQTSDPATSTDWPNFGGDKLWPAPQARWAWPPDPYLDSAALTVRVLPGGRLALTGQASPRAHLRFRREIAMDASGAGVTFRNILQNTGKGPVQWGVWQITQIGEPDHAELQRNNHGRFPKGYYVFKDNPPAASHLDVGQKVISIRRHPTKAGKIGGDSPAGQIRATWRNADGKGQVFTVSTRVLRGVSYPDDGCSQEIYSNADPLKYMELELLGPVRTLRPGASTTLTTRWRLQKVRP